MLGRRYSLRRPTFRDGMTPRRAQSSTVDLGTWSRSATSRAVSTSAAVRGRPSTERDVVTPGDSGAGGTGKVICPVLSRFDMTPN